MSSVLVKAMKQKLKLILKSSKEKQAKDQALNLEKQQQLEEKALKASIIQMIKQHKIVDFAEMWLINLLTRIRLKGLPISASL